MSCDCVLNGFQTSGVWYWEGLWPKGFGLAFGTVKICSVVLLPALKPVCSSAMIFSACGFNLFSMIFSITLLGWLMVKAALLTAALTRLKPVWIDKSISLSSKIRLMLSLVTSIFLYACESWTLTAELQRRIQAMEMGCYRKILHISYKDHVTNEEVRVKIQ